MGAVHANALTDELYKVSWGSGCYLRDRSVYSDDKTERQYTVYNNQDHSAMVTFRARPLPGCCGVVVLYYVRPLTKSGKQEWFTKVVEAVSTAAQAAGFGMMLITQIEDTAGQKALLGMKSFASIAFRNGKTGKALMAFSRVLPQKREEPEVFGEAGW